SVYPKFGATKTPHVYLLDKNLIVKYVGAIDDSPKDASKITRKYVEEAIQSLEAGKDPETKMTKAIGCGIKKKA
ncbi:MAG: thioredoxin family protein, partial [Bacteroidota bacterium]|nr:thioredoxin family protein [Bacteroidota bacterium]